MELLVLLLVVVAASAQQGTNPGMQPPRFPPFLQHASNDARQQFFSIAYNPSMKIADINAQLEQWADKQSSTVKNEYNEQISQQKQLEAVMNQKRQQLVQSLPSNVLSVAKKLDSIRVNLQLTPEQQMKQVTDILNQAGSTVRAQLNAVDQKLGQMLQQQQMIHKS